MANPWFLALGLGVIGAGVGISCGVGHCKREVGNDQAILRLDRNTNDYDVINHFRNYKMVSAAEDPNNHTAIFGGDDGQDMGVLTGFPTRSDKGVMQGRFLIPGLDHPAKGDWISVDKSVADAKTMCAFGKAHELVAKELVVASNLVFAGPLDDMLEALKAAHC